MTRSAGCECRGGKLICITAVSPLAVWSEPW